MNKEQLLKKYRDMYFSLSQNSDEYERGMKKYRKNSLGFRNNYENFIKCEYAVTILQLLLNDLEKLK